MATMLRSGPKRGLHEPARYGLAVLRRISVAVAVVVLALGLPAAASANGDPASDYLLFQKLFLPFNAKVDQDAVKRLEKLLDAAEKQGFPIRIAVILARQDLGTAFSLLGKPQRYAEFLGLELSFTYRDRLLVVMENGFGYAVNGDPDPKASRVLEKIPPSGADVTGMVEAAMVAVRRLAAAEGREIKVSSGSATRDRLTIAAAATAGIALVAGLLLYRRQRKSPAT
jgi:hypothetical protein